jgi:hypothetical protein
VLCNAIRVADCIAALGLSLSRPLHCVFPPVMMVFHAIVKNDNLTLLTYTTMTELITRNFRYVIIEIKFRPQIDEI